MLQVKGRMIMTRIDYLKEKAGKEIQEEVLAQLDGHMAQLIRTDRVLSGDWYDADEFVQVLRTMDQVLGNGDLGLLQDIGAYAAESAAKGFVSVFFRFGSPEFIIKQSTGVWKQYYSQGAMVSTLNGPKKCKLAIEGVENVPREIVLTIQGWMRRICELAGGKNVRVEILESSSAIVQYQVAWS